MLKQVRRSLASVPILIAFGFLYVLNQLAIRATLRGMDTELLKAQVTLFRAADVQAWFESLQARGLWDAYANHLVLDAVHPILYGGFLTAALALVLERGSFSERWDGLLVLPTVAAVCDGIENGIQKIFWMDAGAIQDELALCSTVASSFKWLVVLICLGILVGGLSRQWWHNRRASL